MFAATTTTTSLIGHYYFVFAPCKPHTNQQPMKITVTRTTFLEDLTIGKMYINGEYFCDTLEDKDRHLETCGCKEKVYGKTAIPRGTYVAKPYWWGKHQNWYLWLQNVPCFSGILVHGGYNEKDSLGCVLIGTAVANKALTNTAKTGLEFRRLFMAAVNKKEPITIEIK